MNKDEIIKQLFERKDYQDFMGKLYSESLLDILEEAQIDINDEALIAYLEIPDSGVGTSDVSALNDLKRKNQIKSELKKAVFNPIKKVADWTKWSTIVQIIDLIIVGIGIGIIAIYLPHKWDLEKETRSNSETVVFDSPVYEKTSIDSENLNGIVLKSAVKK